MSRWPSTKAKQVLKALLRIGYTVKNQSGSHIQLIHPERAEYTFAFHDADEIRPAMLSRIAKKTGSSPTIYKACDNSC